LVTAVALSMGTSSWFALLKKVSEIHKRTVAPS
jgi:hypothetical protein